MLFAVCVLVLTLVSLATTPPDEQQIAQVVYQKGSLGIREAWRSREWWLSVLLLAVIIFIWIYFS